MPDLAFASWGQPLHEYLISEGVSGGSWANVTSRIDAFFYLFGASGFIYGMPMYLVLYSTRLALNREYNDIYELSLRMGGELATTGTPLIVLFSMQMISAMSAEVSLKGRRVEIHLAIDLQLMSLDRFRLMNFSR